MNKIIIGIVGLLVLLTMLAPKASYAGHFCKALPGTGQIECSPSPDYCDPTTRTVWENKDGTFPEGTSPEELHKNSGEPCDPSTYSRDTPSEVEKIIGPIDPPQAIDDLGFGAFGISNVLSNIIRIIYIIAAVVFVFMIIWSAFQWITSGGDKEAVGKARSRLTWAIIGIVLLALAFVIIQVIENVTGFNFFEPL